MKLPEIVYFQTITACNGHCHYCPFDDVYGKGELPQAKMTTEIYQAVIKWLADQGYIGRLGFLLHYEPSLDNRLVDWISWTREQLPLSSIEVATNGLKQPPDLWSAVDIIDWVLPEKQTRITSRAGNVKMCDELKDRETFLSHPFVSLGRGAYEAMACGRNVLVFDSRHYMGLLGDGFLTEENLEEAKRCNCSGRAFGKKFDVQSLIKEMKKYNPEQGDFNREHALENMNIQKQVERYLL